MSEITDLILRKERVAILRARARGPAAEPELLHLVDHADDEVREIALVALDEVGDARTAHVFAKALLDPYPMARGAAMRALERRLDPAIVPALLHAYDRSPEPVVRHQVARYLGRIGLPAVHREPLRLRAASEADPLAKEGLCVALAKLGDEEAREEFKELLAASRGRDRLRLLEEAREIGERWLLRPLELLLDDLTPVLRIGVDGKPGPETLRVCDIALEVIVEITGWRLSFPVDHRTNYSEAQRAELRGYLDVMVE